MTRILVTIGLTLIVIGLLWPWLERSGLGRLPGDIVIQRENFNFYFPLTTSILISVVITLLLWFLRK